MRHVPIAVLAAATIAASPLAGVASAAAVCPEGATKFKNSVFYTCTCYAGSNGQKTCFWKPD